MSRGIAIDFALDFAVHFALDFALDLPPNLGWINSKAPTPLVPAQKWPPATPYTRKSPRSLPYASSWLKKLRNPQLYAYLSRRLCFKIVEIPSLRGHSKFLHDQNILQDRLLNFRHPKIFDMRHELNLRRTKIFDMGYEKISRLDLSNFSDICDALKLCRDPTSPVEIELLLLLLKLKF